MAAPHRLLHNQEVDVVERSGQVHHPDRHFPTGVVAGRYVAVGVVGAAAVEIDQDDYRRRRN
jgi:hypothetical protein